MSKKTSKKPQPQKKKIVGGPGKMNGKETGIPFGILKQPTPEQKKAGWAKKKRGQELAKAILDMAFKGQDNSQLKKQAAAYFGVKEKNITVEMMLLFRQAEKAIQKADTNAFNAVMDRTFGKPKQESVVKVNNLDKLPVTFQ